MNYNKLSEQDFIRMVLSNRNLTPCLMIGNYVNAFKREFDGTIERATNISKVRSLIEEYDGVESVNSGYLVIEGIGYLSQAGQNSLLKFIEESKLPIVLLSYQDKVLNTIMSRMKIVVKHWNPIKKLEYVKASEGLKMLNEKKSQNPDFKGNLEIQFMADNSPELYRLHVSAGNEYSYHNKKLIGIISTLSGNRR